MDIEGRDAAQYVASVEAMLSMFRQRRTAVKIEATLLLFLQQ
jgi:hypothetical protein